LDTEAIKDLGTETSYDAFQIPGRAIGTDSIPKVHRRKASRIAVRTRYGVVHMRYTHDNDGPYVHIYTVAYLGNCIDSYKDFDFYNKDDHSSGDNCVGMAVNLRPAEDASS
jgi:hypothetical protein